MICNEYTKLRKDLKIHFDASHHHVFEAHCVHKVYYLSLAGLFNV